VANYREQVEGFAQEFMAGGFTGRVHAPVQRGRTWVVAIEDVLGERKEKAFASQSRAMDFYTELWLGISRTEAAAKASDGDLPARQTEVQGARGELQWTEAIAPTSQAGHQASLKKRHRFNMRKVAEVLESYGMNPAEVIAEVLQPLTVIDPDTGVEMVEHRLAPGERAQVALELLQYMQPKLKSVEMKVEGTLGTLTEDQLNAKLMALLGKATKEGGA
jgi:hypothetical protein